MRKTKVIATIGPSSFDTKVLKEFKELGVNCLRINTAHGDFSQYEKSVSKLKKLDFCVMLDIKGPDVRVILDKDLEVKKNQKVTFYFEKNKTPSFTYDFNKEIKTNSKIFFDNGLLEGKTVSKSAKQITIQFQDEHIIKPNKGVNIPNTTLYAPRLSIKDKKSIDFAKKHGIEYIALSFVRSKEDVLNLKKYLKNTGIGVISKIENWQGVKNIDEILDVSDGVMIARGDLGVEIEEQRIPLVQKEIIRKANSKAKISITATQLLETMITSKSPTRAEVSDVANAILDGTDALMLSGETAIGNHPALTLKVVNKVAIEVEKSLKHNLRLEEKEQFYGEISKSVHSLSANLPIDKIVTLTNTGFSASLISRFRSQKSIIAVTTNPKTKNKLKLVWGVTPVLVNKNVNKYSTSQIANALLSKKVLSKSDVVIFFAGIDSLDKKVLNILEVHRIKDLLELTSKKVS